MNNFYLRFIKLIGGLFLYSFGIVVTINANIGYTPWDVFHGGLANSLKISIGTASMITGLAIGIITIFLREKIGLGTILNMIVIGGGVDIIMKLNFIHRANSFKLGFLMMALGLFVIALASYFYIDSSFGAGPRDSLMVAITRKTGLPIGYCRAIIELIAVLIGWQLGGVVGLGTVISAIFIGFCVQITFRVLKFDVGKVKHESLHDTYTNLKF